MAVLVVARTGKYVASQVLIIGDCVADAESTGEKTAETDSQKGEDSGVASASQLVHGKDPRAAEGFSSKSWRLFASSHGHP